MRLMSRDFFQPEIGPMLMRHFMHRLNLSVPRNFTDLHRLGRDGYATISARMSFRSSKPSRMQGTIRPATEHYIALPRQNNRNTGPRRAKFIRSAESTRRLRRKYQS